MSDDKSMVLYNRASEAVQIPDALNLRALATDLLNSGLYPQIKNATQAITVIAAGQELGLGPTASLQFISIVNGKMCAEAKVWLALFHRSGGKTKILKRDKESCRIDFSKPGREPYISEYTHAMAVAEGLVGKGGAWTKMEETMLQWRAVSNGIRAYDPGVVMGIALTTEEAEDYPAGLPDAGEGLKMEKEAKKGPGRPKAQKPSPAPAPAPEKPATAPPDALPAQKPAPQAPDKPAESGFEVDDDLAAMAEHSDSQTEEDAICAKITKAIEDQGVDIKAFKEWLYSRQARMHTPPPESRLRKFITKWPNGALRFHGGNPEDLKYIFDGAQPAADMFRFETRPPEEGKKE